MKKILLLACCLSGALCLTATAQKKAPLTGLWQQVILDQTNKPIFQSWFKEMYADGRFITFVYLSKEQPCLITNEGTYKQVNDSTIREHIKASFTNKQAVGLKNDLTFKLSEDGNSLFVTYSLPGMPWPGKELWVRCSMPTTDDPATQAR